MHFQHDGKSGSDMFIVYNENEWSWIGRAHISSFDYSFREYTRVLVGRSSLAFRVISPVAR
jgi:hypothetical protein